MAVKVEYYYRTLRQLKEKTPVPFSDPHNFWHAINENKREAFLNNITGYDPDEVCQIIALVDGVAAGYLTLFTGYALIDGVKIKVQHGSDLYALQEYRKFMIGAEMLFFARDLQNLPGIYAGLSEFAKPLYPKMGFRLLTFPRYVHIYNHRIIVEHSRRIKRPFKRCVSVGLNLLHAFEKKRAYARAKKIAQRFHTIKSQGVPHEVMNLIEARSVRFQELHDAPWFDFVLKNTFESEKQDAMNLKSLYLVKKDDLLIGFFIIKIRRNDANGNVFKNLLSAEIKEWESVDYDILSETDIYYLALDILKNDAIDSFAFTSFNKDNDQKLNQQFKRQGTYDVALYFPDKKKNDPVYNSNNWRVRDGYSDTLID